MIPYVEVIGKYTLQSFALVEPSQCWFELSYYDVGEFEVYAPATPNNLQALKMGNYIKIPNKPYLWIIKSVKYTFNSEGARMIDVKGFEAKWLLYTRCILNPYQLESDLDTAVYNLIYNNLGQGAETDRIIEGVDVICDISVTIEDTQAPRQNIGEFLLPLLKANKCGLYTTYDEGQITFRVIQGNDKTDSIIFAQSMDNLISSDYYQNSENKKTFCMVVSKFSEDEQEIEYTMNADKGSTNIDRLEMVVESNLSTKMEDGTEISPSSDLYQSMQQQEGFNQLAEKYIDTQFNAEIDLHFSSYEFVDSITQESMEDTTNCFFIGDLVKTKDEYFDYNDEPRILKYTFKQDSSGYGEEAEYGNE